MRKNMAKKKRKIWLRFFAILLICSVAGFFIWNYLSYNQDIEIHFSVQEKYLNDDGSFTAHVSCGNENLNALDLVTCTSREDFDLSLTANPKTISLSSIGSQEVQYFVTGTNARGKTVQKEYSVTVYVEDREAPIIAVENSNIVISQNDSLHLEENIHVTDNIDDMEQVDEVPSKETDSDFVYDTGWYFIDSTVDTSTAGDYEVTIRACDRSGNEAEPISFHVKVNEILSADGSHISYNTDSLLVVANKKYALPDGYEPSDLRLVNTISTKDCYMKEEAASALENMFTAASKEGITLVSCSGYRSAATQDILYNSYVSRYGVSISDTISSRPSHSDHQTGLAMDIGDHDQATVFTSSMENTPEGQWLYQHAHEYGFILRYPKGKDEITGYTFEPWHYRYIGVEDAMALYNISPDYTLEEYLGIEGGDYE